MHNDEVMRGMMFILLLAMSIAHGETMDLARLKAQFIETMKPVDRVTVTPFFLEKSAEASGPTILNREPGFELTDAVVIQDLARRFEPSDWSGMPCLCVGEARIECYRGAEFVASFTVHHGKQLRASFSPWDGDVILDEAGAKHFLSWFAEHGYEGFTDSQEMIEEYKELVIKRRERVREIFPAGSFALSPWAKENFEQSESFDKERQRKFRESFGDDGLFLRSVWRLLAAGSMSPYGSSRARFIFDCLKQVSAQQQLKSLNALTSESDVRVKLGASRFVFSNWSLPDEVKEGLSGNMAVDLATLLIGAGSNSDRNTLGYTQLRFQQDEMLQFVLQRLDDLGLQSALKDVVKEVTPADGSDCQTVGRETDFLVKSEFARVVLYLAKRDYSEALPVFRRLLENAQNGADRMALEVAISHLDHDGESLVRIKHMANGWADLESMALSVFKSRGGHTLPLNDLVEICQWGGGQFRSSPVKEWAEEELAQLGVIAAVDLPNDETSQCEVAALEKLQEGNYDEARKRYEEIDELLEPLNAFRAVLACGRFGEARGLISYHLRASRDRPIDTVETLMARGYFSFTTGNFTEAAKDFGASIRLSEEEWPRVMEHLALLGANLESRSDLAEWKHFRFGYEGPFEVTDASILMPDDAAILFLQDKVDEARFLSESDERKYKKVQPGLRSLSRAHWLISQVARHEDDDAKERSHLAKVLALGDYADEVHILAHLRERELRWADEMNR